MSVKFIYGMFGCSILDLPFGWERGTDEDGTLIFLEWEFFLSSSQFIQQLIKLFFVSLVFMTLATRFLTCVGPFSGH